MDATIILRLPDKVTANMQCPSPGAPEILTFLENYATRHFAREERCMEEHRCPVALQNKKAHQDFIRRFTEARQRLTGDSVATSVVIEVHRSLADWIRNHILKIDCQLRACL